MKTFYRLLANLFLVVTISNFVWYALTFWIYLETKSVIATGLVGGTYALLSALSGFWFGELLDKYNKKYVMVGASVASLLLYVFGFIVYTSQPQSAFSSITQPLLWIFVFLLLAGAICSAVHTIATSTLVSILVPKDRQAKANGLFGTITGFSFAITSLFSGIAIGFGGMASALIVATTGMIIAISYLSFIEFQKEKIPTASQHTLQKPNLRDTFAIIQNLPGVPSLIFFTTFNNFIGGVFMALMDAYGLSLMPVQAWGIFWGVVSFGFILGGAYVSKFGLGKNPVHTLMIVNCIIWFVCIVFPLQASIPLLAFGALTWMALFPFIEATEQTILQKTVPYESQARVFGLAHSIEQSTSPVTAFLVGPLAQTVFIPFMTTGAGVQLIGNWFGVGEARGTALVFICAGLVGVITTTIAWRSKQFKVLSKVFE
jgi:MFS transporter, DHA3 family, multidrug efflux protein